MRLSEASKRVLRQEPVRSIGSPCFALLENKKRKLYKVQGGRCKYCRVGFPIEKLTYDHVIRKRDGGGSDISNLVLACPPCNMKRELPCPSRPIVVSRWVRWHRQYVNEYGV